MCGAVHFIIARWTSVLSTLNSKRKYTLLDLSSTQRVLDLRRIRYALVPTSFGFQGISTRKITKCILSFGVECRWYIENFLVQSWSWSWWNFDHGACQILVKLTNSSGTWLNYKGFTLFMFRQCQLFLTQNMDFWEWFL